MERLDESMYPRLTKLEKANINTVKEAIFSISKKLGGTGESNPVPYDTAWVARVPKTNNLNVPAFPLSLEWLRKNQLTDGSWGDEYPFSSHSKTLNTLAAVLALAQWNKPEDEVRKNKGTEALWVLTKSLPQEETKDGIFELIMSSLIDDARNYKLEIPYEYYDWCSKVGKSCLEKLGPQLITNKPNRHWFYLEAAGESMELETEYYQSFISRNGLIAAQPSTTAYILRYARLRGVDYQEADLALTKLYKKYDGGIPHFSSCNNFEMIHALYFLFKAGVNPKVNVKYKCLKNVLKLLAERWSSSNGGIGFSSEWPFPDQGCTTVARSVLEDSIYKDRVLKSVLEEAPKISLGKRNYDVHTKSFSKPLFLKNVSFDHGERLKHFWFGGTVFYGNNQNLSIYYQAMCAAFSLTSSDSEIIARILQFFAESQNSDGGWGNNDISTHEETAYVTLALFHFIKQNCQLLTRVDFIKIGEFLNKTEYPQTPKSFWYAKVLFCPTLVTEAVVLAARFALFQIFRLQFMKDVLIENKLDYSDTSIVDEHQQLVFHGLLLRMYPQTEVHNKIRSNQALVDVIKKEVLLDECPHLDNTIKFAIEISFYMHCASTSPEDRKIFTSSILIFLLIDNIMDNYLLDKKTKLDEVKNMFSSCIDILRGKHLNTDVVPASEFPDFLLLSRCFLYFHKVFNDRKWNVESFIKMIRQSLLNGFLLDYKDQCYDVIPTAKRYLQIKKADACLMPIVHVGCLIGGNVDQTKFEDYDLFVSYMDKANKVSRIYNDIFCVPKDEKTPGYDNYVLRLKYEYKVSTPEAVIMAVKKSNREIIKMFMLKQMMQKDPKYKDNKDLFVCIEEMENFADGTLDWTHESIRYKTEWNISKERVTRPEADMGFVWNICFY